jgi:hypothetical protein
MYITYLNHTIGTHGQNSTRGVTSSLPEHTVISFRKIVTMSSVGIVRLLYRNGQGETAGNGSHI